MLFDPPRALVSFGREERHNLQFVRNALAAPGEFVIEQHSVTLTLLQRVGAPHARGLVVTVLMQSEVRLADSVQAQDTAPTNYNTRPIVVHNLSSARTPALATRVYAHAPTLLVAAVERLGSHVFPCSALRRRPRRAAVH
ncbi:hypothetical protein ON010_g427 [Phytophthora cinnamomi]|nr:hypothetical protein ON010_g427 [Phytophthora cinnamomi]